MEKNISDNLRYFPEAPRGIKFWKGKYEFNLALSVIIKQQENKECVVEIEKLQDKIIGQLKNTKILHSPYNAKKSSYTEKSGLYKYPEKNLHFTLINFIKCRFDNKDKLKEFKKLLKHTNYEKIKKKIIEIIDREMKTEIKTDLRWIYSSDKEKIDSISLQAFLEEELITKLKEKIYKEAKKKIHKFPCDAVGIKAYPIDTPRAFAINILRFMTSSKKRKPKESIETIIKDDGIEKVIDIVKAENIKHNLKPFVKDLLIKQIHLVESDPFLAEHKTIRAFRLR